MAISGNKIIYNLENVIEKKPITADVFLNDYCNNKCPYCTYARYGERNGQYMSFNLFQYVATKLLGHGVKGIILTGGGEPTISKDFDKITSWLEAKNIPYGINTNFNVYKEIKPAYLKVSLDAYNRETYIAKRGVDAYEKTLENIKNYLEWKKKAQCKTIVGIQLVVESPEEAEKFYNKHKDLAVDYFNMRPMESTMHDYYNTHDESEIMKYLKGLHSIDQRVTINYKWEHLRHVFSECYAHSLQVAVNQLGELMYCCHKPYEIIGSIYDPDIWEKYSKAKTNMKMCDVPCRLTGPNEFILSIKEGCSNSQFI